MKSLWDHYQVAGVASFDGALPRLRFLCTRLRRGEQALNIGVGGGQLEALALARGVDIHALDPSAIAIEALRARLPMGEKAQVGGCERNPFPDGAFTTVVMSEVLEHLDDDTLARAFAEARRVLVSGGRLLITVPHDERLSDNEAYCPRCGEVFHRWGHVRRFDRASLRELVSGMGFHVRRLSLEAFPDWRRPGLGGLVKSCLRFALGKAGVAIAQPCLFVEARATVVMGRNTDS